MADEFNLHGDGKRPKRTPQQERALGFFRPHEIAQWRRREESGKPSLRLVRAQEGAT